jgi:hypothetical protein
MSGAPPEDGDDAEGRAPKRGRLDMFGELGKLYDAGLMAQKETHEQEMQALRAQKETLEQDVQRLNAHIHTYHDHGWQVARENDKLREQLQKRGGPVAVSNGSSVSRASSDEYKRVWMIYYFAAHELTTDKVEDMGLGLERIETVRLICTSPIDQPSCFSLLYFKNPQSCSGLYNMLDEIIRSKMVLHLSVECMSVYSGKLDFLSLRMVEMRGAGPDKEKILRHFRDWQKRGPVMWNKGEEPRFPFSTVRG